MRTRVTLITDSRFWFQGAGLWTRTRETVRHLSRNFDLQIYFLGSVQKRGIELIRHFGEDFRLEVLGEHDGGVGDEWRRKIRDQISRDPAAAYIFDRTENAFLVDALPDDSLKLLDTHDLVSERSKKCRENNIEDNFSLSADAEKAILDRFDGVICIQKNEFNIVKKWLGAEKVILVPHPIDPSPSPVRESVKAMGLVGSDWHANVNGLKRFFDEVWPSLESREIDFRIFGHLSNSFRDTSHKQIHLDGYQSDLRACYQQLDISINPVFYGAGLKIKSVESLAFGIPLVTTREGASGIEELDGEGLLIARDSAHFIKHIERLITDRELRQNLSSGGVRYVRNNFSREACFGPLDEFLSAKLNLTRTIP